MAQTFAAEGALLLLGVVAGIATARWLGPSAKGEFALITTVVGLVYALTNFGLSLSVVYFTKRIPPEQLVFNALSLALTLGVASLLAVGVATDVVASQVLDLDWALLGAAMLTLPLLALDACARAILQGQFAFSAFNRLRLVQPLAFLPFLVIALRLPDPLEAAVIAWVLANVVSTFMSVRTATRGLGLRRKRWSPDLAQWRVMFGFGARTHLGNALKFFQYRFDVVLIGALLDKRQVGLYVVGLSLAELALRIPDAVNVVFYSKVAAVKDDAKTSMTAVVCRNNIFLTLCTSIVLFVVAEPVVTHLFGSDFKDASVPTRLLLPGGVALSAWKTLAQHMFATARTRSFNISSLCSLVSMVIGCLILVPELGLAGGAIASSIAYVIAAVYLAVAYQRDTGTRLRDYLILTRGDIATYGRLLRRLPRAGGR